MVIDSYTLLEDHKKFLITTGLAIVFSCDAKTWTTIKGLLSSKHKFIINSPNSFLFTLIEPTYFKIDKRIKGFKKETVYVEYIFPDVLDHAACVEFLLSYPPAFKIHSDISIDIPIVKHRFCHLKERQKFFGVITISES